MESDTTGIDVKDLEMLGAILGIGARREKSGQMAAAATAYRLVIRRARRLAERDSDGQWREHRRRVEADAWLRVGYAEYRAGNVEPAVYALEAGLREGPSAYGTCVLGLCYAKLGLLNEAIRRYQEAVALDSRCALAHHSLAELFLCAGNVVQATRHAEKAFRHAPELARSHLMLVATLLAARSPDRAVAAAEAAFGQFPREPQVVQCLVDALSFAGKWQSALHAVEWLLTLAPSAVTHLSRATVLTKLGRTQEAIGAFEAALQLKVSDRGPAADRAQGAQA